MAKRCNTTHIAQHNAIHIMHTTQYSVQHKHIEKHPHSAYLHRRRKIFFSMWAKHSENQICVGGDVVLFIMFFLNYNKYEKLMYTGNKNDYNNYTLGFAK